MEVNGVAVSCVVDVDSMRTSMTDLWLSAQFLLRIVPRAFKWCIIGVTKGLQEFIWDFTMTLIYTSLVSTFMMLGG